MTSKSATPAPRPDPATGLPRPPRAPVEASWVAMGRARSRPRGRKLPPDPEGPMLEWYRHGRDQLITAVLLGSGAPASVFAYNAWVSGEGWSYIFDGTATYLIGAITIMFLGGFLLYNSFSREFVAAGAGWVAHNTGWVRTYDLVQVKIEIDTQPYLLLLDRDLRVTRPPLREIQQNRELWDLVHNGILHSFQERHVHTNEVARRILRLQAPAMRNELRLAREGPRPDEFVIVDRPRPWWRRTPRRYRRGERQP